MGAAGAGARQCGPACRAARGKAVAALARIDAAEAALKAGKTDLALTELAAARELLRAAVPKAPPAGAGVANTLCPIMGSKIDPAKVPDNLTRTHKGRKIGFCCGGCPAAWDKLSDAEKDAALKKHQGAAAG